MTQQIPPEKIEVRSRADLRQWLVANHTQPDGVWLISYRKHTEFYLSYDAIVEECLCFGWIDSLPRRLDADRTMLYLAPRKKGSNWSRLNKERVGRLVESGQMTPAGEAVIARSQQDGTWEFLDAIEAGVIPHDLVAALAKDSVAEAFFNAFPRSVKRGILEWIANAKTDVTRRKRIEDTVTKAAENIRANHPRQIAAVTKKTSSG